MSNFEKANLLQADDIEMIREILELEELELILSENWSSDVPTHRQQIREHLLALSENELSHNQEALANLGEAPDLSQLSMSISHCKGMGGYALTKRPFQIGFDIEETSRMSREVVRRVCEEGSEIDSAPNPAHLWTAKESSFKALLGAQQPSVIGDISIVQWSSTSLIGAHQFSARPLEGSAQLLGLSLEREGYHLAVSRYIP